MDSSQLKSYRCLGETRTGRQCTQRCVSNPNENFSFCADHQFQRSIRLIDLNAQNILITEAENYLWRRLGIGDYDLQNETEIVTKQTRHERNLKDLSDDDENIHTIEIQRPLMQAISSLRIWAEKLNLKVESNLGKTVECFLKFKFEENNKQDIKVSKIKEEPIKSKYTQTIVNEFWTGSLKTISTTSKVNLKNLNSQTKDLIETNDFKLTKNEKDCIDHLNKVYSIEDKETVLGITFPILSSWVWNRVIKTENIDRKNELVKRFIEEMAESKGLCLQGNLTRLMNVFSGLDAEMSIQEVDVFDTGPISESYMQQQVSAAVNRYSKQLLTYDELLKIVHILMKRANASKEVLDDWLKAIEDFVN